MTEELAKTYDPVAIEKKWYDFWEQNGLFNAEVNPDKLPLLHSDSSAQRDGRAAHGPRDPTRHPRLGGAVEADAGL